MFQSQRQAKREAGTLNLGHGRPNMTARRQAPIHSRQWSEWDDSPWRSWAGDVSMVPARHYWPRTLQELIDLVQEAERQTPPMRVHAAGSRWAFCAPGASNGFAVETEGLSATLDTPILAGLAPDTASNRWGAEWLGTYHVEAGVQLYELCRRLDGSAGDLPQPVVVSRAVTPHAIRRQQGGDGARAGLKEAHVPQPSRWSLPTIGGSSGQTLLGAVSTSSHGMDVHLPPLADCVRALHVVGPGGRQHWIERSNSITSSTALCLQYPGIVVHYDDDLLAAAVVSLGRFGIVYSALIDVVPQFGLTSRTSAGEWRDVAQALRSGELLREHRAVQVVISPYPEESRRQHPPVGGNLNPTSRPREEGTARRECFVTTRDLADGVPLAQPRTVSRVVSAVVNDGGNMLRLFRSILLILFVGLVLNQWLWQSATAAWALLGMQFVVLFGLLAGLGRPGDLVGGLCAWSNRHRHWHWTARIVRAVLGSALKTGISTGVGFQAMAGAPWLDDYYRGRSTEVFFDASTPEYLEIVTDHLLPIIESAAHHGHAIVGWFSLRFTGKTTALIGMQQWERTVSAEISVMRGIPGSIEVLRRLNTCAIAHGGHVHWGQQNELDPEEVAAQFPALPRWRDHLRSLARTETEELTFENEYCEDRGLTTPGKYRETTERRAGEAR